MDKDTNLSFFQVTDFGCIHLTGQSQSLLTTGGKSRRQKQTKFKCH